MPEIPDALATPFRNGSVPAMQVAPLLEQMVETSTQRAVSSGRIPPQYADAYAKQMRAKLQAHQGSLEDTAYRAGGQVDAPATYGDAALKTVEGIALPYAAMKAMQWGGRIASIPSDRAKAQQMTQTGRYTPERAKAIISRAHAMKPPLLTVGGAAKQFVLPSLPGAVLGEVMGLARPLSDPKYQRGERGFAESWWEGRKGDAQALGQKVNEAHQNYGVAGVPLQLMHGLLNPVSSVIYGAGAVKDYFSGKNAALNVQRADTAIERALGLNSENRQARDA